MTTRAGVLQTQGLPLPTPARPEGKRGPSVPQPPPAPRELKRGCPPARRHTTGERVGAALLGGAGRPSGSAGAGRVAAAQAPAAQAPAAQAPALQPGLTTGQRVSTLDKCVLSCSCMCARWVLLIPPLPYWLQGWCWGPLYRSPLRPAAPGLRERLPAGPGLEVPTRHLRTCGGGKRGRRRRRREEGRRGTGVGTLSSSTSGGRVLLCTVPLRMDRGAGLLPC